MEPLELETAEVLAFVTGAVPPGATVLEVGSGDGRLAARLGAMGLRVKAVDVDAEAVEAATARGVDARCADFFAVRGEHFAALLFTRSFHHIAPLGAAVAHARTLLAPGGTMVFDEFAHDEMDLASAAWFWDVVGLLDEARLLSPEATGHGHGPDHHRGRHHGHHHHDDEGDLPTHPLERWRERVLHDPPLHGGRAMVDALSAVLDVYRVERVPYLYRYLSRRLPPDDTGARIFERVRQMEAQRIALGLLVPIGLRLVGRAR
jgi:SAM-dependent methyltransferase